jgi:hypothetical protein
MDKYPSIRKCLAVGIILLFIGTGLLPTITQDTGKTYLSTSTGKNQCFDTTPISLSTSPEGTIPCSYNKAIQKLLELGSNARTFCDLSEENTIHTNKASEKILLFGFAFIDGVITSVEQLDGGYNFDCRPVNRVTVTGILQTPGEHRSKIQFFGTFTNATSIIGYSSKILYVSDEYQHFSIFVPSLKPTYAVYINFGYE